MEKSVSGVTKNFKKNMVNMVVMLATTVPFFHPAWSFNDGEIGTGGSTYQFNVPLKSLDIKNNSTGAKITSSWDYNDLYSAYIYCSKEMRVTNSTYFTTKTTMSPSRVNSDYLFLNEYFDVKVEIYIAGNFKGHVAVPFTNLSNKLDQVIECVPPKTKLTSRVGTGNSGRVTFMTTKPIVNGMNLNKRETIELYARYGSGPVPTTQALSKVVLELGIVTVPDKCVINKGTPISIEFGPVGSTSAMLNGENYKKPLSIEVACSGGSFNSGMLAVKLGVQPAGSGTAGFNNSYLGTTGTVNRRDLGIVIRNKNNEVVKPNTFSTIDSYSAGRGRWDLTAAPIAKPGTDIPEGEFSSSASIVASFN